MFRTELEDDALELIISHGFKMLTLVRLITNCASLISFGFALSSELVRYPSNTAQDIYLTLLWLTV